jgi:hypothetical protein
MKRAKMSAARKGHKASDRTVATVGATNPHTALGPCLGKQQFETVEAAVAAVATKGYYRCVWCDGWHRRLTNP